MKVWTTTKLATELLVNGVSVSLAGTAPGACGVMVVFKDRESALAWSDGNESLVMSGEIPEASHERS